MQVNSVSSATSAKVDNDELLVEGINGDVSHFVQRDFEVMAELIPHIVWIAEPSGNTVYFNKRGTAFTGRTAESSYGWGWLELLHPDDVEDVQRAWQQSFSAELPTEMQYRVRNAKDEYRWMSVRALPVRTPGGTVVQWIGTCTDIDDQKRLELALRESEHKASATLMMFKMLQAKTPVGIGFIDRDYRYLHVNERLAEINGLSVADHLGNRVADVVPVLWPDIEPIYARVMKGESIEGVEFVGVTPDDPTTERTWLVNLYPVETTEDSIGIAIVVIDVTMQKRAERDQRELLRAAVTAIAAASEARDPYTAGHQKKVGGIARAIGAEIGFDEHELEGIELTANIHDIGKMAVPAEILSRPGRLQPAEFELVKSHSQAGHDIMRGIEFPWPVAEMILQHHERIDGSGYPNGLKGDEILIGARIIAVADVLEAMASHRPYRAARGVDEALKELIDGRGTRYDVDVIDACRRLYSAGRLSVEL